MAPFLLVRPALLLTFVALESKHLRPETSRQHQAVHGRKSSNVSVSRWNQQKHINTTRKCQSEFVFFFYSAAEQRWLLEMMSPTLLNRLHNYVVMANLPGLSSEAMLFLINAELHLSGTLRRPRRAAGEDGGRSQCGILTPESRVQAQNKKHLRFVDEINCKWKRFTRSTLHIPQICATLAKRLFK